MVQIKFALSVPHYGVLVLHKTGPHISNFIGSGAQMSNLMIPGITTNNGGPLNDGT